ncbi:MAG: hypothetical protein ABI333_30895 [bacterium]
MPSYADKLTLTFERMSRRERLMVLGLALAFAALLLALFGYLILDGLDTRRSHNERMRQVLLRLDKNRDRLVASRTQDARMDVRLDRKPPALQAHLDGLAKQHEVEVKDYKPSKPKELGDRKQVLQKAVEINIYDIELDKFMKFLNAIEMGGYVIMTTQLQVTPRSTDHGKLDIKRLKIATYERNEKEQSPGKADNKKSKRSSKKKGKR